MLNSDNPSDCLARLARAESTENNYWIGALQNDRIVPLVPKGRGSRPYDRTLPAGGLGAGSGGAMPRPEGLPDPLCAARDTGDQPISIPWKGGS